MARHAHRTLLGIGSAALALPLYANCASKTGNHEGEPRAAKTASAAKLADDAPLPQHFERLIAWGDGDGELRLQPHVAESIAYGPNAVATLPNGRALVLDRLAARVVELDADSAVRTVAQVPADSEELVAGADGSFLAFSPLRARAFVFGADGQAAGDVLVPRALHDLQTLGLGPSHRVLVKTGYQETLVVGSPSAPLALAVTLGTKREGAFQLADGRGIAVRADANGARLLVVSQASDDSARSTVLDSHALPGNPSAARIIGLEGKVACLRTERVTSSPAISVERRALCMNVESGVVALDQALPAPGLYLPRSELALGGGRLSFIHPEPDGLRLVSDAVAGLEVAK
jgi:hypothetical protein